MQTKLQIWIVGPDDAGVEDDVPSTTHSQLPATQSTSQSIPQESHQHDRVQTDEVVHNQLALLDAVKDIEKGIKDVSETLKQLLNVLTNK